MAAPQQGFALGVDLGTSNTVAVVRWPDGRTRPLLTDGLPILPSGVYLDGNGRLHVGRDAQRLAQVEPARYEPNPKRHIDEPGILLGDREIPTVDLLAALLGAIARAAVEAVGFLPPAALTYPAAWGPHRREVLAAAVHRAGWPPVRLLPEPVAAARYFVDVLRRPVPVGASLAVFDFGGGTVDIAVVRNTGGPFVVLGSGGVENLGGLDIDAAIVEHLGAIIGPARPDLWQALAGPGTTTDRRNRRLFWDDIRGAKEMLSRTSAAPITVPGLESAVHLTRDELERVSTPLLRRAVQETATVIGNCGLRPDELAGLFLVGGSSRLPLVARMLHTELGIAPTVLEQPELPVAEGALAELAPPRSGTGPVVLPVHRGAGPDDTAESQTIPRGFAQPGPDGPPVSPATYPHPSTSTWQQPVSGPPTTGWQQAASAPPTAGWQQAAPASGPPAPLWQQAGPPTAWQQPGAGAPAVPRNGRGRLLLAGVAAALVLVVMVGAGVWYFLLRGDSPVDFQGLRSTNLAVPFGDQQPSASYSYVVGDKAYLAWLHDQTLTVAGVDLAGGKKLWQVDTPGAVDNWGGLAATGDAVLVFGYEASDSKARPMYALDPKNGSLRWRRDVYGDDEPFALGGRLILGSQHDGKVRALNLTDGRQQWEVAYRANSSGPLRTTTVPVLRGGEYSGPNSFGTPWTTGGHPGDDAKLIQLDYERTLRVIDAANGKVRERKDVGPPDTPLLTRDDTLYVVVSDNGLQLRSYDLAKLGDPTVVYTETNSDKRLVGLPQPCGDGLVCLLEQTSSDAKTTELVAVNTKDRKVAWRRGAAGTEALTPVGGMILASSRSGEPASLLFDGDGKQVLAADDKETAGVRVNGASLLLFSRAPSAYGQTIAVTGVTGAGQRHPLGSLDGIRGASCSWSTKYLTCATDKEFRTWQFAT